VERLQIRDFTRSEADYLQMVCNFTKDENTLFELRLQDVPLEECAERMNVSTATVKRIAKRVAAKIERES
jgi:DNA-directed RNA polymerase specialized sigma24 family protein